MTSYRCKECVVMIGQTLCSCGRPLPKINASIEAKLDAGYSCPHSTRPPNPPTCKHGIPMNAGCEKCGRGRMVA